MGEYLNYSSLLADKKVKFTAWPVSWRPPGADRVSLGWPEWTLVCDSAEDDSTI